MVQCPMLNNTTASRHWLQKNKTATANTFAAYSATLNLTFDSKPDYDRRLGIFESTLRSIARVNAANLTYFVSALCAF